jgi:Domain of Unknown Function (DUF928)
LKISDQPLQVVDLRFVPVKLMTRSRTVGLIILSTTLMLSHLDSVLFIQAIASAQVRESPRKKSFRYTPSGVGAPTHRSDAATRGQCDSGRPVSFQKGQEVRLIALVPENELGLTTAESPAIAFYIPPTCAETMRVSLLVTVTNKSYETFLATPSSSGIINLKFSSLKDFPPLEIGKKYQWELSLVIDNRDPSADASVNGFLQREKVNPNVDQHFWFDTVTALMEARQVQPQDAELTEDWNRLMRLVGLEAIANQPFIPNFTAKSVSPRYTKVSF